MITVRTWLRTSFSSLILLPVIETWHLQLTCVINNVSVQLEMQTNTQDNSMHGSDRRINITWFFSWVLATQPFSFLHTWPLVCRWDQSRKTGTFRHTESVLADCISSALLNKLIINGATGQTWRDLPALIAGWWTACQTTATSGPSASTRSIWSSLGRKVKKSNWRGEADSKEAVQSRSWVQSV